MFKFDARRGRPGRLWSLSIALVASAALAQGIPDMARIEEAFQRQQQASEQALRQYTWESRTEVRVGDKVKSTVLEMVRYGADGTLQKTVIGGQQAKEKRKLLDITPMGALVKHVRDKQSKEYKEGLGKLLEAYAEIPTDKMRGFFDRASFQPGRDAMQGTLRISGTDVVKRHDTLSIWIDLQTREKRQLEVLTSLDGDPVQIDSQFGKLADGTTYTTRTTLEVKPKNLTMITENFDFTRGSTP
jgi:hypothetical protein